jgi:Holliday junction resolvase RusA-like endonuclease
MNRFELTIDGPPLSHQTRDRARLQIWKQTVRDAAFKIWGAVPPVSFNVRISVAYFHDGPAARIDNDNMVKPIQDALNGLVYVDDHQVTHTEVRKGDLNGRYYVRGMSLVLLNAFSLGREFVYIMVEKAPDASILPR